MSRALKMLSLVALLLGAIALSACGGDDGNSREAKNAYVAKVNAAQTEFASTVTTVTQRITPQSSPGQDRRTLRSFEKAIADVVAKLRRIDVPASVTVEHKQLVSAMTGFGAEIRKATAALRNPDTRSIAEAQRSISTATQTVNGQIDAAIAAINSKLSKT
jgi:paraquat-inducible protein B